jgi:hypothetical protein
MLFDHVGVRFGLVALSAAHKTANFKRRPGLGWIQSAEKK